VAIDCGCPNGTTKPRTELGVVNSRTRTTATIGTIAVYSVCCVLFNSSRVGRVLRSKGYRKNLLAMSSHGKSQEGEVMRSETRILEESIHGLDARQNASSSTWKRLSSVDRFDH
jgi:hypothetical protein